MSLEKRRSPLKIETDGDVLTISIGVDTLRYAVEEKEEFDFKITDASLFAEDVVRELMLEEENGMTPVHELLDSAAFGAFQAGSMWCEEKEEEDESNEEF